MALKGEPPLAYALFVPRVPEPEVVRLLLEAGADPNFRIDDDGMTLLQIAVVAAGYAANLRSADELSEQSVEPSLANRVEIIELPLEYGADAAARER